MDEKPGIPMSDPEPKRPLTKLRPAAIPGSAEPAPRPVIRSIGEKDRRHEDNWSRTPNSPGTGAIHVKTFACKMREDALTHMDQRINEWLDAHPQYEVKFVNSSVGIISGKLKEPHLICQVWV